MIRVELTWVDLKDIVDSIGKVPKLTPSEAVKIRVYLNRSSSRQCDGQGSFDDYVDCFTNPLRFDDPQELPLLQKQSLQ